MITTQDRGELYLFVFAWTLTHGGRTRLPDEYRIQMTSVDSPLQISTEGPTILIGYEPNLKMFSGFDLSRHSTFTTGSPSVQIDIGAVRKALDDGIAFDRKSNDEIAIGIRPDQLLNYALNSRHLHKYGKEPITLRLLTKASSLENIPSADLEGLSEPRQRIVQTVSRLSRAANFRLQVLNAYGNRCAVTRAQLRLVDAAHIVPVGAPGSADHIRNGIALSPTLHRAYDAALVYLTETLEMKLNQKREAEIRGLRLDTGLEEFKKLLGKIHLLADRRQWPDASFYFEGQPLPTNSTLLTQEELPPRGESPTFVFVALFLLPSDHPKDLRPHQRVNYPRTLLEFTSYFSCVIVEPR